MPPLDSVRLHIGVEKTGTSTLQLMLALNRERLRQDGVLYPRTPGEYGHIGLALYAAADDSASVSDLRKTVGLHDPDRYREFREALPVRLTTEAAHLGCRTAILSSEHCSSRLMTRAEIGRPQRLIAPLSRDCRIVIYLRRQDDCAVSSYSTMVQSGHTEPFRFPDGADAFDYLRLLDDWAAVFGKHNLDIRIFEAGRMVEGDLVADFFAMVGFQNWRALQQVPPQNRSLDAHALEFLRRFNSRIPSLTDRGVNPERGPIEVALSLVSSGQRFAPSPDEAAEFLGRFAASNAEVARKYLGRSDGVLFSPDASARQRETAAELDADRAVDLAAALWRWQEASLAGGRGNSC